MPLSLSAYCFFRQIKAGELSLPGFISLGSELGVDGVELLDPFVTDREADRAGCLEALEKTGLPCPIYSVSNNFAQPDEETRREHLQKVLIGIEEAGHYAASTVRIFAGDVREGLTFESCRAWIVQGLVEASQAAEAAGVRLALENHGKLAGHSRQVKEIIEEVRSLAGNQALGANPDVGNFLLVDQDSVEAATELAGLAYMAHLKDFAPAPEGHAGFAFRSLADRPYVGTGIGEGVLDLSACVSAIKAGGFDGWWSIEYEAEEDPRIAVPRSIANSRTLLSS